MPSGGWHPPENPAAVSGPGGLSQRTDSQPLAVSGLAYGENGALNQQMTGLPNGQMPSAPTAQIQGGGAPGGAPQPPQILSPSAPSQYPQEPISHGAPFGPGPNSLPGPAPQGYQLTDLLGRMLGNDISGRLEDMYLNAEANGL